MNFPVFAPGPAYLLDACPDEIENPIGETASRLGVSVEMTLAITIGTMSAITQLIADVELNGKILPASISTIVVAGPGEGKSITMDLISKPLIEPDKHQPMKGSESSQQTAAVQAIWEARYAGLLARVRTLTKSGRSSDEVERELAIHCEQHHDDGNGGRFIFSNATEAGFRRRFNGDDRCGALFLDEASSLFNGALADDIATKNKALDGSTIIVDHANRTWIARRPRLTMCLAIQPQPYAQALDNPNLMLRELGFTARLLHTVPPSRRDGNNRLPNLEPGPHLTTFHGMLEELLANRSGPRKIIKLDDWAQSLCTRWSNDIDDMMRLGGYLHGIQDFAGRIVEHTVRLAAVFHVALNRTGPLSGDLLERAYKLLRFFTYEYRRIHADGEDGLLIEEEIEELDRYVRKWCQRHQKPIPWSEVMHSGPEPRKKVRLRPLMDRLVNRGWVTYCPLQGKRGPVEGYLPSVARLNALSAMAVQHGAIAQSFTDWSVSGGLRIYGDI